MANSVNPDQTAPSLIWVHTVYHRGFLNISADEKSFCCELRATLHSCLFYFLQIDSFWDNSTNHGVGNHLTYVVRGLKPLTHYEVVVAAENPAKPPAHLGYIGYTNHVNFTTKGGYFDFCASSTIKPL